MQQRTSPAMEEVCRALSGLRLPPSRLEADLSAAVARILEESGVAYRAECPIGPGCRVDYLCAGGVALEIKRRATRQTLCQLRRYLACPQVTALVLVAERTLDISMLERQTGKPCACVSLRALWGVAIG
nr:hypothetical protein [bacterium]